MLAQQETIFNTISHQLQIPTDNLIQLSLHHFLNYKLRIIDAEIFEICGQYNVANVEEMDERYQKGTLDEENSWRDLQRLDHLEYKHDELVKSISSLS
jgi:hypothetical protein